MSASVELLKAVRAALVADAEIAAAVGDRVSSEWGTVLTAPFIRLSLPSDDLFEADGPDGPDEGSEHKLNVHIFANSSSPVAIGNLAARVRKVLDKADLDVAGADLWWCRYRQTLNRPDPDDPTLRMAIVAFEVVTT